MLPNDTKDSGARWARRLTPSERAAQLARDERIATRDARRAFVVTLFLCLVSVLVAWLFVGLALHTTDRELGQIAFLGGLLVGYLGIVMALARYYLRGEEEGWW